MFAKKEIAPTRLLIIDSDIEKCDYGLAVCEIPESRSTLYLIELKGSDLEKAASQINTTISVLNERIQRLKLRVRARIVLARVQRPDMRSYHYTKLERRIKGDYGGNIKKGQKITDSI